jgi:hypothetical protein
MGLGNPGMGEGYTAAYQISATPWVTSSFVSLGQVKELKFGYITRFISVKNTGPTAAVLSVGFTSAGMLPVNSNYFVLSGSESAQYELRTDRIFVSGSAGAPTFSVLAGLTMIKDTGLTPITGSNGFTGVG